METLKDALLEQSRRPAVVKDCERLIEDEVRAKSGIGGLAVKAGYKIVKKLKPGVIPETVDGLLDDFVAQLEPFFADSQAQDGHIEPYFRGRDQEIANALLQITDRRAQRTRHKTLKKAYDKLRSTGVKHTAAAVPGIARLIAKNT
jgi:hypothetical protein